MSKPAARVGDMHVCPMMTPAVVPIPHVGGPILPPGVPTVFIGGMPAATMTSQCVCVGPPDIIIKGSLGVLIGGKPAARMGDNTAHGGIIVVGFPTVLIGDLSPVMLALLNARGLIENKLKELETWDDKAKANLKKWMGDDSEATRQMMTDRLNKMNDSLLRMDEDNFKPATEYEHYVSGDEDCYAFVVPSDDTHTVYLGDDFATAPETGTNSQAGTIIHEVSHFDDVAGLDDVEHTACGTGGNKGTCYGTTNGEGLANISPTDAQNNADNLEYYLEH